MKKLSFMKNKKMSCMKQRNKEFCYDETKKRKNLNYTKKSEIIVITSKNLEELLIVFAI